MKLRNFVLALFTTLLASCSTTQALAIFGIDIANKTQYNEAKEQTNKTTHVKFYCYYTKEIIASVDDSEQTVVQINSHNERYRTTCLRPYESRQNKTE